MQKSRLLILIILATLLACTGEAPAPDPTETPAPTSIAATPALIPNTPEPEGTSTLTPTPTAAPAVIPSAIAASTATPASSPPPEPTITPFPDGRLAPIQFQDSESLQSSLSEDELHCIGDDPEQLTRALTGAGSFSWEEHDRLLDCLHDETVARLFLAWFVPGPEPLSLEASECVRAAFDVIDPRSAMTAGIVRDPGRAMAGATATIGCLTDEEPAAIERLAVMGSGDREAMKCLMEELGGPARMAETVMASQEVYSTTYDTPEDALEAVEEADIILDAAAATCEMKMGLGPGQATATPPPSPTSTAEPSTPVPTPTTTTTAPPTPAPTAIATSKSTTTLVITVAEVPAGIPEYDRGEWRHWTDEDGDCQDARQEVLITESLEPVTYEDDRQCRVEAGKWWAPHLGHHLENPGHIDVDHHVPLKNAHLSGGWAWDEERKEQYANYLGAENHLVAISARHNRSKGARGPEEWAPPDNDLWCDYALHWAEIKQEWNLTMTAVESEIVMDMLGTCENPPELEVEIRETMEVKVGVHKPTAEPDGTVYGSCEEAHAAGEQRVQGSQGGGRGFSKAMVPSARDGDGDGVVCER